MRKSAGWWWLVLLCLSECWTAGLAEVTMGLPTGRKLTVSAGENKELQLPESSITLSAFVLPRPRHGEEYHYVWTSVSQPRGSEETATMEGTNSDTLTLSHLTAGVYRLRVQVTGGNQFGEAFVNVTVLPPKHQNQPPVAVIIPPSQKVTSGNSFILDGSESKDDVGITSYRWEEVSGPLQDHHIGDINTQTLKLENMTPGHYVFRLTVTDTEGATNSTTADVTVVKDVDYPPTANAGSDAVVRHPTQKSVTLCGNGSTDDRGIARYEWTKASDSLTADMTGVRAKCLHLDNLELGDYTFTLKVVDTGSNTATADVHVYVKPESNHHPVAHTARQMTVTQPLDSLTLDGHDSTGNKAALLYQWTQIGGPSNLTLLHSDQAVATATGNIVAGDYEFRLSVRDSTGQTSSDTLKIEVKQEGNQAPVARAGGDQVVYLPMPVVALDGSGSSDDHGIVFHSWERDTASPAAGDVVDRSDQRAVLELVNVVAGLYTFTLTVTDQQGLTSTDTASLTVRYGEHYTDLVELVLDTDVHHFTQNDKENVVKQLELLIHRIPHYSGSMVYVQSTQQELSNGQLRLLFVVRTREGTAVNGMEVVDLLTDGLPDLTILTYPIGSLDTLVCQSTCSGHGQCDKRTRTCVCEVYWMPDLLTLYYTRRSNCAWSVVYVVVVCGGVVVGLAGLLCGLAYCCCLGNGNGRGKGVEEGRGIPRFPDFMFPHPESLTPFSPLKKDLQTPFENISLPTLLGN